MSKPNLLTAEAQATRGGARIVSDLEAKHREAELALFGAERALQAASAKYDAALGEGRDAALTARRVRADAEVDLDIARHTAEELGRRLGDAREACRLAEIEAKVAKAERLRGVFEEVARRCLARMGDDARSVLRAGAEAEIAIQEARAAQDPGGPHIPDAEEFRNVRRGADKEVGRVQITRWVRPGTREPVPDEIDREISDGGFLRNRYMSGGGQQFTERGVFERVTYERPPSSILMPALIESLCIPALVGGERPGWAPIDGRTYPHAVLARLAELEAPPVEHKPERLTIDTFVSLAGARRVTA